MSSEADDLQASIDVYTTQLQQVNDAIAQCNSDAERESLHNLRADLSELLLLTRQSLGDDQQPAAEDADCPSPPLHSNTTTTSMDASMDAEFNQFLQEIRQVEAEEEEAAGTATAAATDDTTDDDTSDADAAVRLQRIRDELTARLGEKCSAPHTHSWGARTYHNAMICGLDDRTEYPATPPVAMPTDIQHANVLVLFTNPTHREMLPCAYYLDGECRFAADQCHYSHGELVAVGDLRPYRQPDFAVLQRRRRWPVLVRRPDRMWHRGIVLAVANTTDEGGDGSAGRRTCRVRLDATRAEVEVDYADVLPMHADTTSGSDSDEDDDGGDDDDDDSLRLSATLDADSNEDETEEAAAANRNRAALVERSLLQPAADRPLGEWERHTRGFGSRMMQKYGYVLGTGLGADGGGIVVPISAEVLPPGKSLDYCMELREQAGGAPDLFSAERQRKRQQRRRQQGQQRAYERERRRTEVGYVFSFMNDSLLAGVGGRVGEQSTRATTTANNAGGQRQREAAGSGGSGGGYREHTTKTLNVVGYQLGEDIRRQETEQQRLREAMRRHSVGSAVHTRLAAQLAEREAAVQRLRQQEAGVKREQSSRKEQTKLTVF